MTKEQMIQLLDTELDAMNKHRSNIERIKKEYFDSVYGFKKGDKVNVLYKRSKEPLAQCAWNCIAMLWYDKHEKGLMPLNKEEKK